MVPKINDNKLISEARNILTILEAGKDNEAIQKIAQINSELAAQGTSMLDIDVLALWEQVTVAANNTLNVRYFEDVKEELNKVVFDHRQKHTD